MPNAPKFLKSLAIDHARDGEVMIAFGMNGEQLPLLNGFPLRLVVPGWCGVYWIKMLNDIEVLGISPTPITGRRPATVCPTRRTIRSSPARPEFKMVPVTRNAPRSFITNIRERRQRADGDAGASARGIAFGGDCGVARVDLSIDGGKSWQPTGSVTTKANTASGSGRRNFLYLPRANTLMVRCTNTRGEAQPDFPIWNPADTCSIPSKRAMWSRPEEDAECSVPSADVAISVLFSCRSRPSSIDQLEIAEAGASPPAIRCSAGPGSDAINGNCLACHRPTIC